jgi:signal transduction histidine kinase
MTKLGLNVVLIDDDEDYFVIVRDLLAEAAGLRANLTWVNTFEKRLAAVEQNHTDVFLVDYRLGLHTGLEILQAIVARQLHTPVILLTGQGDQEIAVAAMKAGAADYLVKGQTDLALLERSIRHAIERRRVEAELRDREEQLRQSQKMQAIGRLAGGVAHDFNNLLTVITGYCDLLARQAGPDDLRSRELREIRKAADRAAALTRQLLAFSRKQVISPRLLDLNAVVTGMEKMLRRLIGEDVELRTVLTPGLPPIKADEGQLEQVIMNLAINARDAMPQGGRLLVETALVHLDELRHLLPGNEFTPGEDARLCISDNGVGMTAEVKAHLFEPFFTTKPQGQGTGLGLATCYGIIQQAGGHVLIYSEQGHGTTVKIYLPAFPAEVVTAAPTPVGDQLPAGEGTILVVEDEDALRELAACVLRDCGYRVVVAANGEEGVAKAQAHRAELDLIVTDVIMPKMGGQEMITRLQPLPARTKVLFTSGYTDDALAEHGVLGPEIAFMEKPFSPARLAQKVRELLVSREKAMAVTCG